MTRFLISMFVLLYSGALMAATAVVQTATGNVTAAIGANAPVAIAQNSTLESGMTVTTGDNSNIVMKFEDGQVVVLNANTTFKITRYQFNAAQPQNGSAFFSLIKGAMRSISGLIGKHNNSGFRLQTPVATIGIRGTDFMVATGSAYLSVGQGIVSATNAAGTSSFAAGQIGFVAGPAVAPMSMALSQLPASVASSFSQLGGIAVPSTGAASASSTSNSGYGNTATGSTGSTTSTASTGSTTTGATTGATSTTAAGGTAATGAAAGGGLSTMAVAGTAAAVAAVAAIATNNNPTAATTTTTVTQ